MRAVKSEKPHGYNKINKQKKSWFIKNDKIKMRESEKIRTCFRVVHKAHILRISPL